MSAANRARIARLFVFLMLILLVPTTLRILDRKPAAAQAVPK